MIIKNKNTVFLDMKYFSKYLPSAGFKFSLDGIFNVPNQKDFYVGMYSLSPPGIQKDRCLY